MHPVGCIIERRIEMRRIRFLLSMLLAAISLAVACQNPNLTAASKLSLARSQAPSGFRVADTHHVFPAFIAVDDPKCLDALQQSGVKIDAVFNGFATVRIPDKAMSAVLSASGVNAVSLAQPLHWCNDSALFLSDVAPAHVVSGCIGPYDGNGVIVGIVDTGIDFNHINLCDKDGHSRVRAVYLPADTTGHHPVVEGTELPGSCYETASEIAALTTDYAASSHGTHTAGTAAGSYRGNGLNGVAPAAEIVACGIPELELTDVNIANAVKYIFDYADRVGKPCVINLSIGSNSGPNDGSSFLCRAFSSMAGPGRLLVLSAGNDGNAPICCRFKLGNQADTVTTFLRNQWGGLQRRGYVSMWNDKEQEHRSRIVVVNRYTGALEYASPFVGLLPGDSIVSVSSELDDGFAAFYHGEMSFASCVEPRFDQDGLPLPSGRFHSYWEFDVESVQPGHLIGIQYVADQETDLIGWSTKDAYFYSFGLPGAVGGSAMGSISDLATTDSVISVGAYCSKRSYSLSDGTLVTPLALHSGEIAPFSSFGPDERAIQRPDVCAPGLMLVSSANRYDMSADRQNWCESVQTNGTEYPYYANQGTSMSAPVVTGTIALMMQVNPLLTTAAVRRVLERTSIKDDFYTAENSLQWGYGKLDTWAAITDVIENTLVQGDVNNDREINIADVSTVLDIIHDGTTGKDAILLLRADVDRNTEINISDINRIIDLILK